MARADRWTEKDFCLALERLYWGSAWNWRKRLRFEWDWLRGKFDDDGEWDYDG
jgi:hypothetical protein